jgi:uncharacterized alpha-E superfamily protein
MLSRVAETLYWMCRYIERTENMARLINVNNMLIMDLPKGVSTGWAPLIDIIGVREEYLKTHQDFFEHNALKYLLVGQNNHSSVLNSIANARENARTIRDVLPKCVWEGVNSLYYYVKENQNRGLSKRGRFEYLKKIITSTQMIYGAADGTINHDSSYIFMRIGSMIERADMTSRILDVRSASLITTEATKAYENIQWVSLLRSLSAYQMYRQQMSVRVQRKDVIEFIMLSKEFPRSILFCLSELRNTIEPLINSAQIISLVENACEKLQDSNVRELKNGALSNYIDQLQITFAEIHNTLAESYFLK